MPETPRRLAPTYETFRELYLKSGNECAFAHCDRRMIDGEGNFVGEVCHIEAAEEGGERFNPNQTNEERRQFLNLMLMCHEHHVVTNEVRAYTVEHLRQIKADHEAKFVDVIGTMLSSFQDHTATLPAKMPGSLKRINEVLGWGNDEDMLIMTAADLADVAKRLSATPARPKQILCIVISRGKIVDSSWTGSLVRALFVDIAEAVQISSQDLQAQVRVLEEHDLASVQVEDEDAFIDTHSLPWNIWGSLRDFCSETGIPLSEIIVAGKFDLLD